MKELAVVKIITPFPLLFFFITASILRSQEPIKRKSTCFVEDCFRSCFSGIEDRSLAFFKS